jgi:hypothetical protein
LGFFAFKDVGSRGPVQNMRVLAAFRLLQATQLKQNNTHLLRLLLARKLPKTLFFSCPCDNNRWLSFPKCEKTTENIKCLDRSLWKLQMSEAKILCLTRRCVHDFLKGNIYTKADVENKYGSIEAAWLIKLLVKEQHIKLTDSKK